MRKNNYLKQLQEKDGVVLFNEPLSKHTSFGIGGKAKNFVIVKNIKTLVEIFEKEKHVFVLGAGTNMLFSNKKFNATFVKLGGKFEQIQKRGNKVTAGAGVSLFKLNAFLRENGLAGLEFTFGIPGSVGGGIFMNAGAFGKEIGEFVEKVKIFDGKNVFWTKKFNFSYRNSSFKENKQIILAAMFNLTNSSEQEIFEKQQQFILKRKQTQPYGQRCAGSVFKRIFKGDEIIYPAKMIDNLGLKGVKIGTAKISEKHAGFIVCEENANFKDVVKLISRIKKQVKRKNNINLSEEIIIFKGKRNDYFRRLSHTHNLFKRKA